MTEIAHKYYIIDKSVITRNSVLPYDVYTSDENNNPVLMHHKHMPILGDLYLKMMDFKRDLYVHEHEIGPYEAHLQSCNKFSIFPQQTFAMYNTICQSISQIFKNPESLTNYKIAKEHVKELVSTVSEKDNSATSFLAPLIYDYTMHSHSLNVCVYAVCLGKHLNLDQDALEDLGLAAILHDIGKSKIDPSIVNKDEWLTEDEGEILKEHPVFSWNILKQLGIKNKDILDGVRHHHEKLDGSGYPDGLKGDKIHLYARIIGICDEFDILTTRRSYKPPESTFDTLNMMKKEMRKQLDDKLINQFIFMLRK